MITSIGDKEKNIGNFNETPSRRENATGSLADSCLRAASELARFRRPRPARSLLRCSTQSTADRFGGIALVGTGLVTVALGLLAYGLIFVLQSALAHCFAAPSFGGLFGAGFAAP
jgi:hypothetical protein